MRKFLLSAAFAASLALGGCATTNGTTPADVAAQINAALAQAQQVAVQACGFLPTFQTIQDIVVATAYPAGTPIAVIANEVGNGICAAVTARAARLGSAGPTMNGIAIHGHWVNKGVKRGASFNGVQIHGQWVRQ